MHTKALSSTIESVLCSTLGFVLTQSGDTFLVMLDKLLTISFENRGIDWEKEIKQKDFDDFIKDFASDEIEINKATNRIRDNFRWLQNQPDS